MDCQCRSVFNRLSRSGRYALKSAAIAEALTGFIQQDTARHPWRFPFYVGYMALITAPVPLIGVGVVLIALTIGWAKYEIGPMGKRLNRHIKDSFNEESLPERYKDFIRHEADSAKPCRIKSLSLAFHTAKQGAKDGCLAGKHAFKALKNIIK